MNLNITFRKMEHTQALDDLIRSKSEKFEKWFGPDAEIKWTCWADGPGFCSEVSIMAGTQEHFAKAESDDLYKTFDLILSKIQNQIK